MMETPSGPLHVNACVFCICSTLAPCQYNVCVATLMLFFFNLRLFFLWCLPHRSNPIFCVSTFISGDRIKLPQHGGYH